MANISAPVLSDHLGVLFGAGTCTGLTDGELLERFLARRDESGERAFEALVTRHGPMVLRVCRNLLDDPTDVHDAFQAVFLVLARRAGSIRQSGSVGGWLHGVAARLAARARGSAIRRRVRDRRTIEAAEINAAVATDASAEPSIERCDGGAIVHQEVNRLPEKFRAPIVLCYLEGMTHDEAAAQLRWPVGTVRSRLARARHTLRTRLTRRGMTATGALWPFPAGLASDPAASKAAAMSLCAAAPAGSLPGHISTSLARTASRLAAGQSSVAGSVSATSLALAQGVLKTMMLKKLTIAACVLLSLGTMTIGGGAVLVRASGAQDPRPAPAAAPAEAAKPAAAPATPKADDIDPLLKQLLAAARQRVEAQRAFYEEGRITLDRFLDALARLERVQLLAAKTEPERMAARDRFLDILTQVEHREQADLEVGRGTVADVAEATARRVEAEYDLKASQKEAAESAAILRRLSELERKVDQLLLERGTPKASQLEPRTTKDPALLQNTDQPKRDGRKP
jgi:RNA polymerase sigma factor (sigma-70 family)